MTEPLSEYDRILWSGRFADKIAYTDDKLREMLETARTEMAELIWDDLLKRESEQA